MLVVWRSAHRYNRRSKVSTWIFAIAWRIALKALRRFDEAVADRMADKLRALRIFEDDEGRMNLSVTDVGGAILCVSNFTVYGDTRRGNRPGFTEAARPERAEELYERVRQRLGAEGGVFGAHMQVELVNDGPVTLVTDL